MLADVKAFFRAVWWGTLASSGLLLVITVPLGLWFVVADQDLGGLWTATFPIVIAGTLTSAGAVVIGLPYTFVLTRLNGETVERYILGGMFAGGAAPMIYAATLGLPAMLFAILPCGLGMLAGAFSGSAWGDWRTRPRDEA